MTVLLPEQNQKHRCKRRRHCDRRSRRQCAVCKKFLPAERRSSYCAFHQSQRMVAYRNEQRVARRELEQRAMYEAMSLEERRWFESWLYLSSIRDPEMHEIVLEHRAKFGVAEHPLAYLYCL